MKGELVKFDEENEQVILNEKMAKKYLTPTDHRLLVVIAEKINSGKEVTVQEIDELAVMSAIACDMVQIKRSRKFMVFFLSLMIVALLGFVALIIGGIWIPALLEMTDWLAVILNFTVAIAMILGKETLSGWHLLGWKLKVCWWAALLINISLFAYNLLNLVDINFWG